MASHMNGLHGPNRTLDPATLDVVRAGGFRSVKLMHINGCHHSTGEGRSLLDSGVTSLCLRLPDSRKADGTYYSYAEYADECVLLILNWYHGLGCRLFQVDNEPNWQWMAEHYGPYEYQWFMKRAAQAIRHRVPPEVYLVGPPLSFASNMWNHDGQNPSPYTLDEWHAAYDFTDGGQEPNLWQAFDLAGANSYFRSDQQIHDPSYGKSYHEVYQWAGMSRHVAVLEWGNTIGEGGQYTDHELEMQRCHQYPTWLTEAQRLGVVDRAFVWLAPTPTVDWAPDSLSAGAAHCMAHL